MGKLLPPFRTLLAEAGLGSSVVVFVLLANVVAVSIWSLVGYGRFDPALAGSGLVVIGALHRRRFLEHRTLWSGLMTTGGVIYGLTLFLGDRLGVDRATKMLIIVVASAVVFDVLFWTIVGKAEASIHPPVHFLQPLVLGVAHRRGHSSDCLREPRLPFHVWRQHRPRHTSHLATGAQSTSRTSNWNGACARR